MYYTFTSNKTLCNVKRRLPSGPEPNVMSSNPRKLGNKREGNSFALYKQTNVSSITFFIAINLVAIKFVASTTNLVATKKWKSLSYLLKFGRIFGGFYTNEQ